MNAFKWAFLALMIVCAVVAFGVWKTHRDATRVIKTASRAVEAGKEAVDKGKDVIAAVQERLYHTRAKLQAMKEQIEALKHLIATQGNPLERGQYIIELVTAERVCRRFLCKYNERVEQIRGMLKSETEPQRLSTRFCE